MSGWAMWEFCSSLYLPPGWRLSKFFRFAKRELSKLSCKRQIVSLLTSNPRIGENTKVRSIDHSFTFDAKVSHLIHCCPVRMWLFSIVSLIFRVFSFTLIVTALRYWALPLYFFLILGAIIIGAWANTDHESFVIIGSKSLLWQNSNPCTGSLILGSLVLGSSVLGSSVLGSSVLGLRILSPSIEYPQS